MTKESQQTLEYMTCLATNNNNNNNSHFHIVTPRFNPHNNHNSALHITPDGTKKHINYPHNHTPLNDCSVDVRQQRVQRERTEVVTAILAGTSCEARVGEMSVTFAITRKT